MSPFFLHLLRIITGYMTAALVMGIAFTTLVYSNSHDPIPGIVELMMVSVGMAIVIGYIASVPAILTIIFSEWRIWRSPIFYGLAGIVSSIIMLWLTFISDDPNGLKEQAIPILVLSIAAGLGGIAYWAIAGRRAGEWRADGKVTS